MEYFRLKFKQLWNDFTRNCYEMWFFNIPDADDYEPPARSNAPIVTDKWDGEDEDDDIKDAWDKESSDEDSSKGSEEGAQKAVQRKKKKKMHEIIAEREAAKVASLEEKEKIKAAQDAANTPEGKLAEKLRAQKIAELDSLEAARDMLGVKSGSIDAMVPTTKDEFEQLNKAIVEKVQLFSNSSHYSDFVEALIKDLSLDREYFIKNKA